MNRPFLAILIVVLGIGLTSFIRLSTPDFVSNSIDAQNDDGLLHNLFDDNNEDKNGEGDNTNTLSSETTTGKVNLDTLAKHNKLSDCWVAYGGKVYDVTSFLPKHPGSASAISPYCGTYEEFTKAFEGQHGKSKISNLMRVGTLMGDFEIQGAI